MKKDNSHLYQDNKDKILSLNKSLAKPRKCFLPSLVVYIKEKTGRNGKNVVTRERNLVVVLLRNSSKCSRRETNLQLDNNVVKMDATSKTLVLFQVSAAGHVHSKRNMAQNVNRSYLPKKTKNRNLKNKKMSTFKNQNQRKMNFKNTLTS